MLDINHNEVIAAQVAGSFATDSREPISISDTATYWGGGINNTHWRIPVLIGTPETYRAGDIVVILGDDKSVKGVLLR